MPSKSNIPQQLTSFVGREEAIASVKRRLLITRLLTLTGTGGTGKTRLALKLASEVLPQYPDGAWFVDLATLTDPALVPQAVASVLGVREERGQTLTQTLLEQLKPLKMLLILDNCEHLVTACASLTSTLLHACPEITILTTSRENLGVSGEAIWQVPPMSLPEPNKPLPVENLRRYESIQLFVERALRSRDIFALTEDNAQVVTQLCWQLDGLPLAIELAAARVRVLSVEQILERLDQRFKLLKGGSQDAAPRQQTLKALIDWSYDLLNDDEKGLLRALSVFVGSFTLEAVTAICGDARDEFETLDLLTLLVEKSLVVVEEHGGEARYRLLETIRQYALEKREEVGETPLLCNNHLDWYLQLAEKAQVGLLGEDSKLWLDRLELEHDNIRAALELSISIPGENRESGIGNRESVLIPDSRFPIPSDAALRLAGAVWRFWDTRGYIAEGRKWLADALRVSDNAPASVRAKALNAAGNLALEQGDYAQAEELYFGALELRRDAGDKQGSANSLANMGVVARRKGEYEKAAQMYEESLLILKGLDSKDGVGSVLGNLGFVAQCQGDYDRATALYNEALEVFQEIGSLQGMVISLNNLGEAAQVKGDYEGARTYYDDALAKAESLDDNLSVAGALENLGNLNKAQRDYRTAAELYKQSLVLYHEQGDQQGMAECLEGLASIVAQGSQGNIDKAVRLFGAAEAMRDRIGSQLPPNERAEHERDVAEARSGLKDEVFHAAWRAGRLMPQDEAVRLALEDIGYWILDFEGDPSKITYSLTRREIDVLRELAQGLSDTEIAEKLSLSPRTVQSHLQSIYSKLQVTNRSAAGRLAVKQGLV